MLWQNYTEEESKNKKSNNQHTNYKQAVKSALPLTQKEHKIQINSFLSEKDKNSQNKQKALKNCTSKAC